MEPTIDVLPAKTDNVDHLIASGALPGSALANQTLLFEEITTTRRVYVGGPGQSAPGFVHLGAVAEQAPERPDRAVQRWAPGGPVVADPEHFYRDDQLMYPNEEDFERAFRQSSRSTFMHNLPFYVVMAVGLLVVGAIVFIVVGAVAGLLSWLAANLVTILMWGLGILACFVLLSLLTGGKVPCPGLHCGGCSR